MSTWIPTLHSGNKPHKTCVCQSLQCGSCLPSRVPPKLTNDSTADDTHVLVIACRLAVAGQSLPTQHSN
jgi:hypothetical protein